MRSFSFRFINNPITLLAFLSTLTACSGGLIGTATGPSSGDVIKPNYGLRSLPSKLTPKIPKTLTANNTSEGSSDNNQSNPENTELAKSWQKIAPSLSTAELTRLKVQETLTLLDSVLPTLLTQCSVVSESCVLSEGTVQAQYTTEVISQLHLLIGYESPIDNEESVDVKAPYQEKLGSWLTFGEIEYQRQTGSLYDHAIRLDALSLLNNRRLNMQWNNDASEVNYEVIDQEGLMVSEYYRYQNLAAGQQLTFHWDGVSKDINPPVTFQLSADYLDIGPVSYHAYLNGEKITGRASEEQGYAIAMNYEDSNFDSEYYQESFSTSGELIEFIECELEPSLAVECSLDALENDLYTVETSLLFEELQPEYSVVSVRNIPVDIFEFEIRSANYASIDSQDAVYCHGFQYPGTPPATETFCFVEPEIMIDAIVIGFNQWGEEILIPDAVIEISNPDPIDSGSLQQTRIDIQPGN